MSRQASGSARDSFADRRLPETVVAGVVTEEQMCALSGLGRNPNDLTTVAK